MNYLENYSLLFVDTLFANTVLYGGGEVALSVMMQIGGYDKRLLFVIAIAGYMASIFVNYWLGRVLFKIYNSSIDNDIAAANYKSLQKYIQKFGWIILSFNMIPAIGPFLPVIASFIDFGIKRTLLFASITRAIYYLYLFL